jgi:chemotaxis protein MotB
MKSMQYRQWLLKYFVRVAGVVLAILVFGCVSPKKFEAMQEGERMRFDSLNALLQTGLGKLESCRDSNLSMFRRYYALRMAKGEMTALAASLRESNARMVNQLHGLARESGDRAERIRQSLDSIRSLDSYIQRIQVGVARNDSTNMALVINLKSALGQEREADIHILVDKWVVKIDVSDELLFGGSKYEVSDAGRAALGKLAGILKNQPAVDFQVEGHTDDRPFSHDELMDNWDLSAKRATAVVRILQNQFGMSPEHLIAAGRSEFVSLADNDSPDGRATNRRTRILVIPSRDQWYSLLHK